MVARHPISHVWLVTVDAEANLYTHVQCNYAPEDHGAHREAGRVPRENCVTAGDRLFCVRVVFVKGLGANPCRFD